MKSVKELLKIDGSQTAGRIESYIRDAVNEHKVNGIIMGLSGGIDSALLATLSARALGRDKVRLYFLHDKNSEKDSEGKARLVADWLGLKLNIGSITDRMREKEKNAVFFKFISSLPPFIIPIATSIYYIVVGETPYVTTLRKFGYKNSPFKKWVYNNIVAALEDMFDGPCEERRKVLEEIARKENLLLIGTGNRSEDMTGWFTIEGVDNMPCSPIKCLYKTQVKELAEYLDIPQAIRNRVPSADVLRGATDTLALGMSFEKIDIALHGIENKIPDEQMMQYGITRRQIEKVKNINRLSEWRRAPRGI